MNNSTFTIIFLPDGQTVSTSQCQGQSLLEVALNHKIDINHACGGHGTCGSCLVKIIDGAETLPKRNEIEKEMAEERSYSSDERLACQTEACGQWTVKISNR